MSENSQTVDSEPSDEVLDEVGDFFRPIKRRKLYRKRTELAEEALSNVLEVPLEDSSSIATEPTTQLLNRRKTIQRRKGGIEFSNAKAGSIQDLEAAIDGQLHRPRKVALELENVENRFARQTGQIVDVDKHMMAYIDSELAKRRQLQASNGADSSQQASSIIGATFGADLTVHRQPATLGKLQEIDLGPDATARNIAATQAAKRRLAGELPEPVEAPQRVRLRPDGKPWRQRRRRNSEDVKRDQLVEEVMRESKIELYTEPDAADTNDADDQAADDRLAEKFRRDFMDALSVRRKRTATTTTAKGAKEEASKGPRLGGSRSARAAMREMQEKEKAGKK